MSEGIDVSRHQPAIDWPAAKAGGIEFAYIKVTEGVGYVDPKVDAHLGGARAAGIIPGLYHFARPDTNSGRDDALHFAEQLKARNAVGAGNLPPCLDLEERSRGALAKVDLVDWVSDFLAAAREATGRRQWMLYASASFARDRLGKLEWLDKDCLAWIAHYGRKPGNPGWRDDRTVMHQYTSSGRIPGYGADIDRNSCWVDLATLTGGSTPAPPKPPPPPPPSDTSVHVVQSGDNLSGIASRYGIPGGWQALYNMNRDIIGPNPNVIHAGQRLRLSGGVPAVEWYTIQSGDNLSAIAASKNVAGGWQALYNANRDTLDNPNVIYPGRKIRIPR